MPEIANILAVAGHTALGVTLASGILSVLLGISTKNATDLAVTYRRQQNLILLIFIGLAVSLGILVYSLVTDQFALKYVVEHSSTQMQVWYKVASLYSGQAGSLMTWTFAISLGTLLLSRTQTASFQARGINATTILTFIILAFLFPLTFLSSPFQLTSRVFTEGIGLNPLLVDPTMLIHPPTLLIGLASTSIPFAISLGMIISKTSNVEWSRSLRRWTLISLLVLSAGNFLGAWWAYTVLGWGGYWGWDPVENCAILPLIPLAVLLHSKPLQERIGLFYTWNLMLGCLPFVLAIFGTFNVRSGLITSVHSFAESDIGPYFLGLLALTLLTPAVLLTLGTRAKSVTHNYDSVLSRETGLIINNFLLLSIGLVILGGTLFPVASELANGARIVVGPLFFADTVGPLLAILLIFMAFTTPLAWTKTSKKDYLQRIKFPISLAVLATLLAVTLGADGLINLLAIFASAFAILIHSFEICRAITKNTDVASNPYDRVVKPFKRNPRRYGGYIAHIGLAIMAIGIISSTAYESRNRFTVEPGDSFSLGDYSFEYKGLWGQKPEKNGIEIEAGTEVALKKNSEIVNVLRPGRRFFYAAPNQPVAIVDIDTSLIRDVYVFTQGWDEKQVAEIQILIKPLVQWLWIGAGLYIGGVLVSLSAKDNSILKNS